MAVVELPIDHVTWVDERVGKTNTNYWKRTSYLMLRSSSGTQARGYLWLPNPFAQGANVASAKLRLRTRALPAGTHQIGVQLAGGRFSLSGIHWANQPGVMGPVATLTKTGAQAANTLWEIDVTDMMQLIGSGADLWGIRLTGSTPSADGILVQGDYSSAVDPVLVVDWSMAPEKPTSLSPSGGRAVSVTNPTLRWDFRDVAGATSLKSIQVQVSTTSNFTSPTYDSGEILTSWCQHTVPADTFPGGVRWWRVRNRDTANLWSPWSDPASAWTQGLPTVAITSPTATTHDPTPPVTWTASVGSGRARESWRAALYIDLGRGWVLHDHSGTRLGSDLLWTPTKYLPRNVPARAIVDVFDDADREQVPNARIYGSATVDFTCVAGPIAGISALTATQAGAGTRLEWSRTELPDEWVITRDGRSVARVSGADLAIGGGRYRFDDVFAPGGRHTWKIWAVVNRVSAPSGAITADVPRVGVWLVDPDRPTDYIVLAGTALEQGMGDTSTTLQPIGAAHPVTITTALGGWQGRMDGTLTDDGNFGDPRTMRDLLMEWRPLAARGKEFRMLAYDQSYPVELSGIYVGGDEYGGGSKHYSAGFSYVQTGEYLFEAL